MENLPLPELTREHFDSWQPPIAEFRRDDDKIAEMHLGGLALANAKEMLSVQNPSLDQKKQVWKAVVSGEDHFKQSEIPLQFNPTNLRQRIASHRIVKKHLHAVHETTLVTSFAKQGHELDLTTGESFHREKDKSLANIDKKTRRKIIKKEKKFKKMKDKLHGH